MVEAGGRGEIDVLYSSGGNFLEVLPEPDVVDAALARIPLRVHQDVVLSTQMFTEPGEVVVLLPAATRYEQRDGGTETTTERRIAFSPEIRGPRPGEVRSEWEIFVDLARRVAPERADLCTFASGQEIRDEIARVVPVYSGVELLRTTGDAIQWGGTRLCEGGTFPTPDGRARFLAVAPSEVDVPAGQLRARARAAASSSTRWCTQQKDPLTGAMRDALFMAAVRHRRRSVFATATASSCVPTTARCAPGCTRARCDPATCRSFFPEGNVLLRGGPSRRRVGRARLQRGGHRRGGAPVTPDDLLAVFDVAAAAQRGALATLGPGRAPRPHRPARPVPRSTSSPTPRCSRCCTRPGLRVLSEESGWTGPRRRRGHRRARSGRRFHQLRARHPVLGDLAVRARRRRPVVRAGAERRHRRALLGGARRGRAARPRRRSRPPRPPRSSDAVVALSGWPPVPLAWRQFRALGSAALALCDVAAGSSRRLPRRPPRPARAVGLPRRRCSCARKRARWSSTPTGAISSRSTPTARRQLVAAGTQGTARARCTKGPRR